jgi:hypothetical protein
VRYVINVDALRARVRKGRIVVDEPTDLPEGTELELVPHVAEDDDMTDEDRIELDAVLLKAHARARVGHTVDAETVLAALGMRR